MWPRVMSVLKQVSMTRGGDFVVLVPNVCGHFVFCPCFVMQSSFAIILLRKRELVHLNSTIVTVGCPPSVVSRASSVVNICFKGHLLGFLTKLGRTDPYMVLFNKCSNDSSPLHI